MRRIGLMLVCALATRNVGCHSSPRTPREECVAPLVDCGSAVAAHCTATQTDGLNCGACGHACAVGEACTAGQCVGAAMCGNGVREGTEQCDNSDLARQSCTLLGFTGGTLTCAATCTFDTSACVGSGPICGNGIAEGLEECDGSDLRGMTCRLLGYWSAVTDPLRCKSDCTFDVSACSGTAPVCGNNDAEGLEECDGFDLRGFDCTTFGYACGMLGCDSQCRIVTGACTGGRPGFCGDGIKNGLEQCDGADLVSLTCVSLGFAEGGTLKCSSSCRFDISGCSGTGPVCGNNIREGLEECDGSDDYLECGLYRLTGGSVPCNASCTGNPSGCDPPHCGDGQINVVGEVCDGADSGCDNCQKHAYTGGELYCRPDCSAVVVSGCSGGPSTCGNGIPEPGELCDGSNLGIYTNCQSLALGPGALTCLSNCLLDLSQCTAPSGSTCGDGIVAGNEMCDGNSVPCSTDGFGSGTMTCYPNCALNLSACSQ